MKTHVYGAWERMKSRCKEGGYYQKARPTYIGCTYAPEWTLFKNFEAWAVSQVGYDRWELDKDILVEGNKHYSPDTCIFVPSWVNSLVINAKTKRGLPTGVYLKRGLYISRLSKYGNDTFVSSHTCPVEAHLSYLTAKVDYLTELKPDLDKVDTRIYPSLLNRYEDMRKFVEGGA